MPQVFPSQNVFTNRANQIAALMVKPNGDPLPMCGLTGISILLPKADDTWLEKPAVTGVSWGFGDQNALYVFQLTDTETNTLKLGKEHDVRLRLTYATTNLVFTLKNFLNVVDEPL